MRATVVCGFVLLLAVATSCSPAAGRGAAPAEPSYPAAQAWALDDGVVTESEYRTAIDGFVSCMRGAGFSITDPVLSPIDGLTLLYDLHPSGDPDVWNKRVEECDTSHVSRIEPDYVATHNQMMEPSLRSVTAGCLSDNGVDLSGNERNVKDFVDSAGESGSAVMRCVSTSMRQVFPDYPGFLKIRW